jgi:hypothetical protein
METTLGKHLPKGNDNSFFLVLVGVTVLPLSLTAFSTVKSLSKHDQGQYSSYQEQQQAWTTRTIRTAGTNYKYFGLLALLSLLALPLGTTQLAAAGCYDNFDPQGGTFAFSYPNGQTSPNGKWVNVYGDLGAKGVATETDPTSPCHTNNIFYQQPRTSTSPSESHASLTTTTQAFGNFQMTLNMKTVKQLRLNSPPNTWETAWVFWHYTGDFHYYALVLKTNGLQIEKKDNNNQCDACEIYLSTNSNFPVKIGQWQALTLRVTNSASGTPHIQAWVDGLLAADFIDTNSQTNLFKWQVVLWIYYSKFKSERKTQCFKR